MKRYALLAVVMVACSAALAQAQVIGTYRPSLVTYYPSASSVTPVTAYRPVPTAARYASAQQSVTPVVNAAYTSSTPYVANSAYVAQSPVVGGACGCPPVQTIGGASQVSTVAYSPAVQTVAYQQPATVPVQTVGGRGGLIDGKYYVGKGLLGRPKVYAEGQPVRNALRAILP